MCTYLELDNHYMSELDESNFPTFIMNNVKCLQFVIVHGSRRDISSLETLDSHYSYNTFGDNSAEFVAEIMSLHYADPCCVI